MMIELIDGPLTVIHHLPSVSKKRKICMTTSYDSKMYMFSCSVVQSNFKIHRESLCLYVSLSFD